MKKITFEDGTGIEVTNKEHEEFKRYLIKKRRLKGVNKRASVRSVWNCIDRPIRGLVYQLNRIGLKTRYSCCGFNYDNEEEPKTHHKFTYIQFYVNEDDPMSVGSYDAIKYLIQNYAEKNGDHYCWTTGKISHTEPLFSIRIRIRDYVENMYYRDPITMDALHDYEPNVILIKWLEKQLKMINGKEEFTVVDGNTDMVNQFDEWLVKPKQSKTFKVEPVFYSFSPLKNMQ